jgi:hypothetical protein
MTDSTCPTCDAPIQEVQTRAHRTLRLEREPDLDGRIQIEPDGCAIPLIGAKAIGRARAAGTPLYSEHLCGGGRGF